LKIEHPFNGRAVLIESIQTDVCAARARTSNPLFKSPTDPHAVLADIASYL
jgi:hypothetical protein